MSGISCAVTGRQYDVTFGDGPLGLRLAEVDEAISVIGFPRKDGVMGAAEATGIISKQDVVIGVNEDSVVGLSFDDVVSRVSQNSS